MAFKVHVTTVMSLEMGKIVARKIIKMLEGKTFDVVSSHTGFEGSLTALEGVSLKSTEPVVSGTLIKILLTPRKSLSFDIKEKPVVFFESERQIRIERRLSAGHKIIRTILINGIVWSWNR